LVRFQQFSVGGLFCLAPAFFELLISFGIRLVAQKFGMTHSTFFIQMR
jgi:hypothetical protein